MTARRDGTGRTEMWREWADRQPVPPWRQNAPDPEVVGRNWDAERERQARQ